MQHIVRAFQVLAGDDPGGYPSNVPTRVGCGARSTISCQALVLDAVELVILRNSRPYPRYLVLHIPPVSPGQLHDNLLR